MCERLRELGALRGMAAEAGLVRVLEPEQRLRRGLLRIGLWQSLHASPRSSCVEPIQNSERPAAMALDAHRVHLLGVLRRARA